MSTLHCEQRVRSIAFGIREERMMYFTYTFKEKQATHGSGHRFPSRQRRWTQSPSSGMTMWRGQHRNWARGIPISTPAPLYKKVKAMCVVSAETVNTFKNRLDRFWSNQDVLYDYRADLHGISNRTIVM